MGAMIVEVMIEYHGGSWGGKTEPAGMQIQERPGGAIVEGDPSPSDHLIKSHIRDPDRAEETATVEVYLFDRDLCRRSASEEYWAYRFSEEMTLAKYREWKKTREQQ